MRSVQVFNSQTNFELWTQDVWTSGLLMTLVFVSGMTWYKSHGPPGQATATCWKPASPQSRLLLLRCSFKVCWGFAGGSAANNEYGTFICGRDRAGEGQESQTKTSRLFSRHHREMARKIIPRSVLPELRESVVSLLRSQRWCSQLLLDKVGTMSRNPWGKRRTDRGR